MDQGVLKPPRRSIGRIPIEIQWTLEEQDRLKADVIVVAAAIVTDRSMGAMIAATIAAVPGSAGTEGLEPARSRHLRSENISGVGIGVANDVADFGGGWDGGKRRFEDLIPRS